MSPAVTPTAPEILGWLRGFAGTYLDHHAHPALDETARDHANLALVNFNMHVMAAGSGAAGRFLGVDRLRIAREILEAPPDDWAVWEYRLETIDPLWKKGLCGNLAFVANAIRQGALNVFGSDGPPAWTDGPLSSGLLAIHETPPAPASPPERRVLVPTEVRFLEKTLHDALRKPDVRAALQALGRIEGRNTPEATFGLRRIASELLSRDRIEGEKNVERQLAASQAGLRALMALARRSDAEALKMLDAISEGEMVLFGETPFGPQILSVEHPLVAQTVALVLLKGDYGFEGQRVLEEFLQDQAYLLSEGQDPLEAVLKYRSGRLLIKLLSKNAWMDRAIRRPAFSRARFHVTVFQLHLLEPIARAGRSETLRWLLRHPDLVKAVCDAAPRAKTRAVHSLISLYHQTAGEGDRQAVADLIEETGHETAVAFFRGEVFRLRHTRSLGDRVRSALGIGPDRRELLQARIDRMVARRGSRSA